MPPHPRRLPNVANFWQRSKKATERNSINSMSLKVIAVQKRVKRDWNYTIRAKVAMDRRDWFTFYLNQFIDSDRLQVEQRLQHTISPSLQHNVSSNYCTSKIFLWVHFMYAIMWWPGYSVDYSYCGLPNLTQPIYNLAHTNYYWA